MTKTVTLTDYTNQEFDFLAEMIHEKLIDLGYETDGTFAFTVTVTLPTTNEGQEG